ncbi:MAG: 6-bladed beta-propeller [Gemmatimonadales bacterium]
MTSERFTVAILFLLAACGGGERPVSSVTTSIDREGDTVEVAIRGTPGPLEAIRAVEEVRIAPASEDTSLFTEVYDFEVDNDGRFWVFDRPTGSIFLFAPDGKLLRRVGRRGGGPGEFQSSNGMEPRADGGIVVLDAQNARISFLDSAGALETSWRVPAGFSTTRGLERDAEGTLYLRRPVTDPAPGDILGRMGLVRLKPGGDFADSLVPPDLGVVREAYVATNGNGENRSMSATRARHSAQPLEAWQPAGGFVAGNGGTGQLIVARPGAKPVRITRDMPAVPIEEAERDGERARITYSMRRTQKDWSWSGPELPSTKAPFRNLQVTRDGRLWVTVAVPSERIPDDELQVSNDPERPVEHFRTPTVFEVYEPTGEFVGRLECGNGFTLIDADGDRLWAIVRDELDLPGIVRFRLEIPAKP